MATQFRKRKHLDATLELGRAAGATPAGDLMRGWRPEAGLPQILISPGRAGPWPCASPTEPYAKATLPFSPGRAN